MDKKGNLKEYVYNAVLEDIFSMKLKPGEILNEKVLIEKYECSKSPVREALLALCAENVLKSIPRYGYEVIRLTRDDIMEMIRYRKVMEGGILLYERPVFSAQNLQTLEEINRKCSDDSVEVWKHWEYNTEFHLYIMECCRNRYALEELQSCMLRMKRAYAQAYWNRTGEIRFSVDTRHHDLIIAALKEGNLEAAAASLAEDLCDFGGPDSYRIS